MTQTIAQSFDTANSSYEQRHFTATLPVGVPLTDEMREYVMMVRAEVISCAEGRSYIRDLVARYTA